MNALSEFIPEEERVVVIEDTAELQIQHVPNLVRLETRSAGTEDCKEIVDPGSDPGIAQDETGRELLWER